MYLDGNRRLAQVEDEVLRCSKEYFLDLYNIDTQELVAVHMCGFDGIQRGKYFGGEPIGRVEVEIRVGKGGGDRVVDWILRLCNMGFENGIVPEDWRSAVVVPLYKSKGERNECNNYRGISLLSMVGKIYAGILINRVCRVTRGLIDGEPGGFREGRGCVEQTFTLKQKGEKARENVVYAGL